MDRLKDLALGALWPFFLLEVSFSFFSHASPQAAFLGSLLGALVGSAVWNGTSAIAAYLVKLNPTKVE